jgi:dihydroxyacid dehydratase/phosphogluconate dehydratase
MEEIYEVTSALVHLPWGKYLPLLTDARFSGVSTGACIGWISPEALSGGPLCKLRDGDLIEIAIDRKNLSGSLNLVGIGLDEIDSSEAVRLLAERPAYPDLRPHPKLPDDTRLWAALQDVSGGVWGGAIYDVDMIIRALQAGADEQLEYG